MENSLRETLKLGWKATISEQIGGQWLKFSPENTGATFSKGCTVDVTDFLLTVVPDSPTDPTTVNIGDILFDYTKNTDENSERKATVTLEQINGSSVVYVYIFTQVKDSLIASTFTDFNCEYYYTFEASPSTATTISGERGGTIDVYSNILNFIISYKYIKNYLSAGDKDTYFTYMETEGNRKLSSGLTPDISEQTELSNYDQYLEDVTRVFKRSQYADSFFGFSSDQYETQFTYDFSASARPGISRAKVYSNIVTSPKVGQHFSLTLGRNPIEEYPRNITISGFSFNGEYCTSHLLDGGSSAFTYTQESGYTSDKRIISIKVYNSLFPYKTSIGGCALHFNEIDSTAHVYIKKETYDGPTILDVSGATRISAFRVTTNEGQRKYPEYNTDELIQVIDGGAVYPVDYADSVCVRITTAWTDSSCRGRQDDCSSVYGMNVVPGTGATYQKLGNCYCNGNSIYNTFTAEESETHTNTIVFNSLNQTKTVNITSNSGCNNTWLYYQDNILADPCVNNTGCPCITISNPITGTTYDYDINFEFEYDYNKIRGQRIRLSAVFSVNSRPFYFHNNVLIPSNAAGRHIDLNIPMLLGMGYNSIQQGEIGGDSPGQQIIDLDNPHRPSFGD